MNAQNTPFKVGETYPDGKGAQVEIIHILPETLKWPMIGIRRYENRCPEVTTYDLHGDRGDGTCRNLIRPAKPKKRVALGPEDVPPGSVVSSLPCDHWLAVTSVDDRCMAWNSSVSGLVKYSWADLVFGSDANGLRIKRPGEDWQPMWKEIDDEGGVES